jgi:ABC-type uncharacterized transport system substrate-binding protein
MNGRRAFIGAIAVAAFAATTLTAAQQAQRLHRIGLLGVDEFETEQRRSVWNALAAVGWVDGGNLAIETRYANGDPARLPALADELVRLNVEIIVGAGTAGSLAAKRATARIPVEGGVARLAEEGVQAIVLSADPLFATNANAERILDAAQRYRPATMISQGRGAIERGGLISFSADWDESNPQSVLLRADEVFE